MFCFILLLGHNILGTELMAGLCTYIASHVHFCDMLKCNVCSPSRHIHTE